MNLALVDSNPTSYLSLITEILNIGLKTYEITTEQSNQFTSSFSQKVLTENKVTAGTELNVSGVIKMFNIGSSSSVEFINMTTTEKFTETSTTKRWATTIKGTYNLDDGQFFFTAAEMELYVFKDHEGTNRRLAVPTGKLHNGAFSKNNLNNWLMDKSFEGLMRTTGWHLPTYSLDELESKIRTTSSIPSLPRALFPDPALWYYIENTQYPGSRLYTHGSSGTGGS